MLKQIKLTKHALQRGFERTPAIKEAIKNMIIENIQENWKKRTPGNHPAKWELTTELGKYKIAEDGSVLTILEI